MASLGAPVLYVLVSTTSCHGARDDAVHIQRRGEHTPAFTGKGTCGRCDEPLLVECFGQCYPECTTSGVWYDVVAGPSQVKHRGTPVSVPLQQRECC